MSRAHLIVIGAGVVGASVAHRLAAEGARVTVVDAAAPGSGTSGASFAWTNAFDKPPRAYHDLNVASMAEHAALTAELGGDWFKPVGNLQWEEDPDAGARLRQTVERLRGWSYPLEWLSRKDALALEPDLAIAPHVDEIVFAPGEGYVEVVPMVAALLATAREKGATVLGGQRVTAMIRAGQRIRGVETAAGQRIEGDAVIDCAGPAAAGVARLAGVELPVGREPGRLIYTAPAATTLRRPVHAPGVHFRPDGAGRIVLAERAHDQVVEEGALEAPGWAPADSVTAVARHLPCLQGVRVEAVRVGVRPMPEDRLPIVGAIPGIDGFYAVVSHSGVTLGPLWGRLAATELLRGEPDPRLAPFRPARFEGLLAGQAVPSPRGAPAPGSARAPD
jgi:glycine/D-amino acid oxidase-like deaminating enzyme